MEKQGLLKIKPFTTPGYDRFALTSLTAYCVYWLKEWGITPSLENVAVASHRMFPAKFAMVGWPEFPDVNRTNRSVLQMRPKYRNLATSVSDKGVFLNQNGVRESLALTEKLGPPKIEGESHQITKENVVAAERGSGKPRSVHPEDILEKAKESQIFRLYSNGHLDEAEAIHLIGLLGVYDHTPSPEKRRKLKLLADAASEVHDLQVMDFVREVKSKFEKYLNK